MEQSVGTYNAEAQKNIKASWDKFARVYDQFIQINTLQLFNTLLVHTHAHQRKRILEVACGSGMHSLYLAKTMLQRGAVLVSTDISEEMIGMYKEKFEGDEDFTQLKNNKLSIIKGDIENGFNPESYFEDGKRSVVAGLANNEALPFTDASFDCYLANLSLMLVDNHLNQLSEALRVTQPGATFGFTVWGRREFVQNMACVHDVFERNGVNIKKSPSGKTPYDLGKDPEALRAVMEGMGYKEIRMWYQKCNFAFKDPEEYVFSILEGTINKAVLSELPEEQAAKIRAEVREEYMKRMGGDHVMDPNHFECLIITAKK
ncbi:hypothetical protein FGO68_gene5570 [Halteria grandinella]|uniref:Methyltransferase type 11 domain-containing protein n=1 Tax=Halteria grandinella TaxID=5974 RepID=A0A8J8NM03_HALGN|nr:hypothetical protein FGO68_gene5570 [Halteria grandinella]